MNERFLLRSVVIPLGTGLAAADVHVSNFTSINGSVGASGVWRNQTTLTDLAVPVSITQTGGLVKPVDHPTQPSRIDGSFPWQDNPFPPFTNFFEPNFDGDFINIEVAGAATASVTIDFNAQVTDPILSFSDVDTQTAMVFAQPFTVIAQSGNILASPTSITSTGAVVFVFNEQAAGSIRFSGTFTGLTFTIVNNGPDPVIDDDRIGFVVATLSAPVAVTPAVPKLDFAILGDEIKLEWRPGDFTAIEGSYNLKAWMPVPGLDVENQNTWTGSVSTFGSGYYFRGVYDP